MAANTTRYNSDPPFGAIVLQDRQNLNDMIHNNPETVLNPENGGYYLKTMDGEVLAITGDDLCVELDAALASVDALGSAEHGSNSAEHESNFMEHGSKQSREMEPENQCSHPHCFTSVACLSFSHCHVCLSRGRCI